MTTDGSDNGPDDDLFEDRDEDRDDDADEREDDHEPVDDVDDTDDAGGADFDMDALPEIPRAGEDAAASAAGPIANTPAASVVARMSERSLSRTLGMNAYQKGRGYARRGNVLDATIDGWTARGRVHGRANTPYDVKVDIQESGSFASACSCPAWRGPERHCKHVAALLVCLRDRLRSLRDGPGAPAEDVARRAPNAGRDPARRGGGGSSGGGGGGGGGNNPGRRHGRHEVEAPSGPREVVVVDRLGPRVVSASGTAASSTVQSSVNVAQAAEPRSGWQVWLPPEDPKKAPEFEYRVQFKTMLLQVTAYNALTRAAVHPEAAIDSLGPYSSTHRPILRALSRSARGGRHMTVDLRGEDAAEMLTLLKGKRVLIEPNLMELRFADDPLAPKMELELVPSGGVRVRVVFERKSDSRRFGISQGAWFEGAPGWQVDTAQGVARPLTENLTPVWLERLSKAPSIVHPLEEMGRLLTEIVPKAALALNTELPDLASIADVVDASPTFVLHAEGDLTVVEVSLKASYGEVELEIPPTELPPPLAILPTTGGRPKVIRRDIGAERAAVDLLFELGLGLEDRDDVLVARGDKAVAFWTEGVGTLPDTWDRFIPEDLVDVTVRSAPVTPRARVSSGVDWLALDVEFESEGSRVDEEDLRRAIVEGRRLVRLEDGTWAPVSKEQVEDVLLRMAEIFAQGRQHIPLSQAGRIQELLRLVPGARVEPSAREILTALADRGHIELLPVPKGLKATMRPYQVEGFSWLAFLHRARTGGVLADDMGLGKTLETLAMLVWMRDLGVEAPAVEVPAESLAKKTTRAAKAPKAAKPVARKKKADDEAITFVIEPTAVKGPPSLVVAPTSVVTNWLREIQRFAPSLKAIAWTGADREKRTHELATADLVITSYALMRRDEEILQGQPFAYVILDEAQNIKNPLSATARAAKRLRSERRLALTGTPIENRLSEIWSIFDFLSPGMLGDLSTFEERYSRPIDRGDAEATRRLRATIGPLVLRRTKSEVAKDLPERIVSELTCELPTAQRALYQQVLSQVRSSLMGEIERVGVAKSQIQILAALTRLRQAACDPRLLKLPGQFDDDDSGKLDALKEILSEAMQSGHRTLVFSQFVEMLTLIRAALDREGIRYEYLDGATKDRQDRVDRFNRDENIPVFLISLKAGGSGLNLTGADTVVHFDPWWNPAVEDQATDRAHRIGQTRVVTAYRLIARGTIEEKIMTLSGKKRELVTSVLGAEEGAAPKGLTRSDVDLLFADD